MWSNGCQWCWGSHAGRLAETDTRRKAHSRPLPTNRATSVRGTAEAYSIVDLVASLRNTHSRNVKRDGVNTYLNDDNSVKTSDCLKLPTGVVVPFIPSDSSCNLWVQPLRQDHVLAGLENESPEPDTR